MSDPDPLEITSVRLAFRNARKWLTGHLTGVSAMSLALAAAGAIPTARTTGGRVVLVSLYALAAFAVIVLLAMLFAWIRAPYEQRNLALARIGDLHSDLHDLTMARSATPVTASHRKQLQTFVRKAQLGVRELDFAEFGDAPGRTVNRDSVAAHEPELAATLARWNELVEGCREATDQLDQKVYSAVAGLAFPVNRELVQNRLRTVLMQRSRSFDPDSITVELRWDYQNGQLVVWMGGQADDVRSVMSGPFEQCAAAREAIDALVAAAHAWHEPADLRSMEESVEAAEEGVIAAIEFMLAKDQLYGECALCRRA